MFILPFEPPVYTEDTQIYGVIRIPVCSKADWDYLIYALAMDSQSQCVEAIKRIGVTDIPDSAPAFIIKRVLSNYKAFILKFCEDYLDIFEVPDKPDFDGEFAEKLKTTIFTFEQNYIHNHTGLNFLQIQQLNILEYKMLLADAVKLKILSRADGKGKEYLNECYNAMHKISNMFG